MNQAMSGQTDSRGLSQAEARERLRTDGPNELPAAGQRNIRTIALEVLREPVFLPLLSAGIIYLPRGDVSDALMLLAMPWLREIFHFTPITPQQFALCIAGPGSVLWFELYKFFRRH